MITFDSKTNQMIVIFVLIGFSLIAAIIFLIAFFWNVRNGQYDDDYTPSIRILFDDEKNGNINKLNTKK